jgi:hypothetical protein
MLNSGLSRVLLEPWGPTSCLTCLPKQFPLTMSHSQKGNNVMFRISFVLTFSKTRQNDSDQADAV